MISHARRCGYAWIKAAKDRGIDINADKDGYLAVISGLIDELESDATRCPNCENLRLERNEHARWRQDLADKLDEVERHRDALAVALNKCENDLMAAHNSLAQMMLRRSLATGHGDTVPDMVRELEWQIVELQEMILEKTNEQQSEEPDGRSDV